MLYFLLLVVNAPFWLMVPVVLICLTLLINRYQASISYHKADQEKLLPVALIILVGGLAWLGVNINNCTQKHGGWDAWAIWNYHARFMADGTYWRGLFKSTHADHPDYPLMLPSFLGFIIRLFSGRYYHYIPLVFSVLITVCITTLLFVALARKNIFVAGIVLYFVVTDQFFVQNAVSQYADSPLAFFFLCALIALGYAKENSSFLIWAAAFLGCCAWTKNEGMILAGIFLLFHAKMWTRKTRIGYVLTGGALPLLVWLILKLHYAPPNDMVSSLGKKNIRFFATERFQLVYTHFIDNIAQHFYWVKILFFIYLVSCALQRKFLSRNFILVVGCLVSYQLTYIFTPYDLEWHLSTSQSRLMLQLMPAFVFIMAGEIAQIEFLKSGGPFSRPIGRKA